MKKCNNKIKDLFLCLQKTYIRRMYNNDNNTIRVIMEEEKKDVL